MPIAATRRACAWVVLAVVVVVIVSTAPAVGAHALVLGVDPADGEVVQEAPSVVTVTFTEQVSPAPEGNAVLDADAVDVAVAVAAQWDELRFTLPDGLADGTYVITWRVVSADSHPVTGSSIFHVGAPSASGPASAEVGRGAPGIVGLRGAATALQWLAALTAVGAAWFGRRWRGGGLRVRRLVRASVAVAVAAIVVVGLARVVELGGRWGALTHTDVIGDTLGGPVGLSLLLLAVGVLCVGVAVHVTSRRRLLWAVGAAAVAAAAALEGHTRTASPQWLATLGDVVHVGAVAIWLGGVAALVVARPPDSSTPLVARAADVSAHALVAVVAAGATGVVMAASIAPDLEAFTSTRWGRAVLVKVVLVVVLAAIGWYHRARVLPRLAGDGPHEDAGAALRTALRGELVLFAGVLVATGVAVGSSPVGDVIDPPPAVASRSELVELTSGVGTVQFVVVPAAVGYNDVYLQIDRSDGEPLETIFAPTATLAEPDRGVAPVALSVHELGDGAYHVPVHVPFAGRWELTVEARTGTFESGSASIVVPVDE